MAYATELHRVIDGTEPDNSGSEMLFRSHGLHICKEVTLGGTGVQSVNALQLTGSVLVLNQWAIITEVTTLNNLTNAYATLYDGTNTVNLTADGMTLSGAPVGTFFTKDLIATQPYTVNIADQCRMMENTTSKYAGKPFVITQKNGANTYIRFNYTTTDNPRDCRMWLCGNAQVNGTNRSVSIGIKENNTGQIISPMTVRCAAANQPYPFSLVAYLDDVEKDDYFEIFLTSSTNGDLVILQDLTWYFESR